MTDIFLDWSKDYPPKLTQAAKELRDRFLSASDPEEIKTLREQFYDETDKRTFCVVVDRDYGIVRHVFRVADDAPARLEEVKEAYYAEYREGNQDEFNFFVGFHNAEQFMKSIF